MSAIINESSIAPTPVEQETSTFNNKSPNMSEQTYKYKVKMTCEGCSGAVTRVLTKAQKDGAGVDEFTVSLESQEVVVKGPIAFDDLTARIAKTGKEILEKEVVAA